MSGSFILDTNIVIALFAHDKVVEAKVAQAEEVFVPIIVIGELYYGAKKSLRTAENIARIEEFTSHTSILTCDEATARFYGEVKDDLRRRGTPIPENDIWIAAIARRHDMSLAARDTHFQKVTGLRTEVW